MDQYVHVSISLHRIIGKKILVVNIQLLVKNKTAPYQLCANPERGEVYTTDEV